MKGFTGTIRLLMMSHLSDVQELVGQNKDLNNKLNFVKWLMQFDPKNGMKEEVDADQLWKEFTKTTFYKP